MPLGSVAGLAAKGKADGNGRRCRKLEVVTLRRLRCCAGCDAPASFAARSVSLPHGPGGTEPGTLALGGDSPPCQVARRRGSPASASASSLPRLCLLTELNLQFHGLVTMSLVYKIHELLGGVERRGDECGKKTRLRVSRQRGHGWCCQHLLTWVPLWSRFGAQRWGEHLRAPWGGGGRQRGWVPTRGEMLASPGDTPCVLTCSLSWKVCRAPCSSWVAFGESSDEQKSFRGRRPDAAVMGSWKQTGGLSLLGDPGAGSE